MLRAEENCCAAFILTRLGRDMGGWRYICRIRPEVGIGAKGEE